MINIIHFLNSIDGNYMLTKYPFVSKILINIYTGEYNG